MKRKRRSYDLVLRVYTPKPEEVAARVERALKHVRQVVELSKEFPALRRVVLLVPRDYDCGQTYQALSAGVDAEGLLDRVATYAPSGHHSCEVLNFGLRIAHLDASHAIVISGKAMPNLTSSALRRIDQAFEKGAKVSGLAVDELRDIVLGGCIQNTFAVWEADALWQVGGFDSSTGVEEIAPLARLVRKFGPCIAPIDPGAGKLDIHASETARARHHEVMTTKIVRQKAELKRVDADFSDVVSGLMPGYPRSIL